MKTMLLAGVTVVAVVLGLYAGLRSLSDGRASVTVSPTDLIQGSDYEVAYTTICSDGDPSHQVREWHFGGVDRSLRNQQTVDWYRNFDGRKVNRIEYRPEGFVRNGKKYMRVFGGTEYDQAREGFDANGNDDKLRRGDFVVHNIVFEPQAVVGPCGPAR